MTLITCWIGFGIFLVGVNEHIFCGYKVIDEEQSIACNQTPSQTSLFCVWNIEIFLFSVEMAIFHTPCL